MRESIAIPILYDADTGYGGPQNVAYAAKRVEEAGMAGLCIEDKAFPKQTSLKAGASHTLLAVSEFADKIKAALDARSNPDFLVVARTEALIAGLGQSEALDRAYSYEAAGADCILVHSKSDTPNEILSFIENWKGSKPLALVPTTYPELTEPVIEALEKVKIVIYGNQVVRASVKATKAVLHEIRADRGIHKLGDSIAPLDEIFALQGERTSKSANR